MITKKEFADMTDYFRKKYFDNIPAIPCYLEDIKSTTGEVLDGRFVVEQNRDYVEEDDELLHNYEYSQYVEVAEGLVCELGTPSWTDPLNHPTLYIVISKSLRTSPMRLVGTLLHELAHYWCWYCGYDYHDGNRDYENKLKSLGLPSNWDHKFNKEIKMWEDDFDYSKMESYYNDFLKHRKAA